MISADVVTIPDLQIDCSNGFSPRYVQGLAPEHLPITRPRSNIHGVTIDIEQPPINASENLKDQGFASKKINRILCATRAKALASLSTLQEVYWSSTMEHVLHTLETEDYVLIRNNLNAPSWAQSTPSQQVMTETILSRADLLRALLRAQDLTLPLSSAPFSFAPSVARAEADESLATVAARMAANGLDGVAIIDHGIVRGVVTARGLLAFLRHQLESASGALRRSGSHRAASMRRGSSGSNVDLLSGAGPAARGRESPTVRLGPGSTFNGLAAIGVAATSAGQSLGGQTQRSFESREAAAGASAGNPPDDDDDDVAVRTQRERRATERAGRTRYSYLQMSAQVTGARARAPLRRGAGRLRPETARARAAERAAASRFAVSGRVEVKGSPDSERQGDVRRPSRAASSCYKRLGRAFGAGEDRSRSSLSDSATGCPGASRGKGAKTSRRALIDGCAGPFSAGRARSAGARRPTRASRRLSSRRRPCWDTDS